ncbi:hypothetical protein [Nonomuraea gerenzanensis]|uniref:hypothetical protein n=1 Tax=Nonomuraea gerenzanensis TaxID=93944 RepID=UPI001CDA300E|nr:hypothetical protein [Nonomuraea gerenzanensis]UBU10358.1 hypothetical protein LCN96_39320 [Nonomuraea gerenzanensis]
MLRGKAGIGTKGGQLKPMTRVLTGMGGLAWLREMIEGLRDRSEPGEAAGTAQLAIWDPVIGDDTMPMTEPWPSSANAGRKARSGSCRWRWPWWPARSCSSTRTARRWPAPRKGCASAS